jgi:hypothetical protein
VASRSREAHAICICVAGAELPAGAAAAAVVAGTASACAVEQHRGGARGRADARVGADVDTAVLVRIVEALETDR